MKRLLLSVIVTLYSVFSWAQSSVVQMGEAVVRCNDFAFAKTMLLNEGLSIVKFSKLNNANTVVLSNGSESTYSILYVTLTKYVESKKIATVEFKFHPNGRFYSSFCRDLTQWGYSYYYDNDGLCFKDMYNKGTYYIGINADEQNWMEVTFCRVDD